MLRSLYRSPELGASAHTVGDVVVRALTAFFARHGLCALFDDSICYCVGKCGVDKFAGWLLEL
jgi:hypothetical protein